MKRNVLHYGHFLKSDFKGHSIEYDGDLGVFVGPSNQYQAVPPTNLNSVHDCTIISPGNAANTIFSLTPETCNGTTRDFPRLFDIRVYCPGAESTLCGESLAAMAKGGRIRNVTALPLADITTESIVSRAWQTLGMTPPSSR